MKKQIFWKADPGYTGLTSFLERYVADKGCDAGDPAVLFLLCGPSIDGMEIGKYFDSLPDRLPIRIHRFSAFRPNPKYEEVLEGLEMFRASGAGCILAVGGGSAIDVAKCIKLFSGLDPGRDYLSQDFLPNEIPFIAVPTTAGTGSESTQFAVIYRDGRKCSVQHESLLPDCVLMDPDVLRTLPEGTRKASLLDACCHAIESFWSVRRTEESMSYAETALRSIRCYGEGYLRNEKRGNAGMLEAANLAGCAINLSQTTGGHAMSYGLTGRFGLAHGHAAALCVERLWPLLLDAAEGKGEGIGRNADAASANGDNRSGVSLETALSRLAAAMGYQDGREACAAFSAFLQSLRLGRPCLASEEDLLYLEGHVNPERMGNHPVPLDKETVRRVYLEILGGCAKFIQRGSGEAGGFLWMP